MGTGREVCPQPREIARTGPIVLEIERSPESAVLCRAPTTLVFFDQTFSGAAEGKKKKKSIGPNTKGVKIMVTRLRGKQKLGRGPKNYPRASESPSILSFLFGFRKLGLCNIKADGFGFIKNNEYRHNPEWVSTEDTGVRSSVVRKSFKDRSRWKM